MTTYSNPRMKAVIENWPSGAHRTTATFEVEVNEQKKRQRGTRITINPKTGKPSERKVLTYASEVRIVDGDDGKTYLIEYSGMYGFITVMRGDMKIAHETIWPKDGAHFTDTMALFDLVTA